MARIAIFTIGCKVNQGESEELKMSLAEMGHTVCNDPCHADLCVVNTCTVTSESDRKCRKLIHWLGKQGVRAIVAAGCYAQVKPHELECLPGVVRVLTNTEKDGWSRELAGMLPPPGRAEGHINNFRTRGFVKVQDGCERRCSYCIVPDARGCEYSRPFKEIKEITSKWLEKGTKEVVICGINLGRYNLGPGFDISCLLREVASLGDDFRLRLSSIELEDLRMHWLEEWSVWDRICPHLHLPLQSGDDKILCDMGRGYSPEDFVTAANALRAIWPQAALTTEVIVGYPGESEDAFHNTVEVLEKARPSRIHVFRFSRRPGTPAWHRDDQVPPPVMDRRSSLIRELAEGMRVEYAEGRKGCACQLLVERLIERDGIRVATGTTEDYMKASLEDPPRDIRPGCLIEARVRGVSTNQVVLEALDKQPESSVRRIEKKPGGV